MCYNREPSMGSPSGILTVMMEIYLCLIVLPVSISGRGYDIAEVNEATDCRYNFLSSHAKNGTFMSPHYPDGYPESKRCHYVFEGRGKERVQIQFEDLDLHYDVASNPGHGCDDEDSVIVSIKIDGQTRDIGRYCGNKNTDMLMSNSNKLDVYFITRNRGPSSARGFKATYRFVTDFGIKTGHQDPEIVCGFEYRSTDARNGTFTSPNYPGFYPRNTECHYIFYGQEGEKVNIQFPYFDVEGLQPNCDEKTESDYLEFSNFNIPDRKMNRFCGIREDTNQRSVNSDGPFFRVLFKSNDLYDAVGFQAFYQFIRAPKRENFGIKSGDQDPNLVCGFNFRSSDATNGTFTSPNYPGLYPRGTECHYTFYGSDDRVHITFPFFDVEGVPPNCDDKSDSDYLDFSNFNNSPDRKMPRFCGVTERPQKKEVQSDGPFFKVLFKSNDKYDAQGFEAFYQFRKLGRDTPVLPIKASTEPIHQEAAAAAAARTTSFLITIGLALGLLCS